MLSTTEQEAEWYRPSAGDLARQVVQLDRSGNEQNYGNLVVVYVGGVKCLTDEMFALSLGWDYEIMVTVPMFCKEYVLCFCPDLKMKWAKDPDFGTPVFQPSQDGDIYIAVETYLYLINTEDISTVVQTLKEPHPHYRSVWVGARRLI